MAYALVKMTHVYRNYGFDQRTYDERMRVAPRAYAMRPYTSNLAATMLSLIGACSHTEAQSVYPFLQSVG